MPEPRSAGSRTATAQWETPRIITPSSTAWPPTGASRIGISRPSESRTSEPGSAAGALTTVVWLGSVLMTRVAGTRELSRPCSPLPALATRAPLGGAALEALDAATCVYQLLAAGVERVAFRADLDVKLRLRRASRELVAAGAAHMGFYVLGVDSCLHGQLMLAALL